MPAETERTCFGRLMALSHEIATIDSDVVTRAVDGVLTCGRRYNCRSHLACSWMASELATRLMERFR